MKKVCITCKNYKKQSVQPACIFWKVCNCGDKWEKKEDKLMTNIELLEWLSKGNGLYKDIDGVCKTTLCVYENKLDDEVDDDILIKSWDSDEWIKPFHSR